MGKLRGLGLLQDSFFMILCITEYVSFPEAQGKALFHLSETLDRMVEAGRGQARNLYKGCRVGFMPAAMMIEH